MCHPYIGSATALSNTTWTSSFFPSFSELCNPTSYSFHLNKCLCLTCSFVVDLLDFFCCFVYFSPYTLVLLLQLCTFLCVLHLLLTVVACFGVFFVFCFVSDCCFFCSDSSNHKHDIFY